VRGSERERERARESGRERERARESESERQKSDRERMLPEYWKRIRLKIQDGPLHKKL